MLTCRAEHLVHHIPVETIEHVLALPMLFAECRPELRPDAIVERPGVLADDQFRFSLPTGLQQCIHLGEGL